MVVTAIPEYGTMTSGPADPETAVADFVTAEYGSEFPARGFSRAEERAATPDRGAGAIMRHSVDGQTKALAHVEVEQGAWRLASFTACNSFVSRYPEGGGE